MNNKKMYVALGRNVFVKELENEAEIGGLIIPDSINDDFTFGEVISVPEGYFEEGHFVPSSIAIGDKVMFAKVSGIKIDLKGEKLIRVYQQDIVAKEVDGEILQEENKTEEK